MAFADPVGHGGHPYRSPAVEPIQQPERSWLYRIASAALVALVVALGSGYWFWLQGAQARAVAALPSTERARLLARTLEDLRLCHSDSSREALKDYCEKQAELALAFPECNDRCRELARLPWAGPRRR